MDKITICLLLGVICISATPLKNPKIVGGHDAKILDYPYQVSLQENEKHFCGASIIGKKWILTAAHCTDGMTEEGMSILAGITNLNETGQRVKVAHIHQHPNYNDLPSDCDVSVLELESELALNDKVQIIEMDTDGSDVTQGIDVVVSGWGATKENGPTSPILQYLSIPVIDRTECKGILGNLITENMICAGVLEGGKDSCHRDSGGPLVTNGKQVGIVSWGIGCAQPNYPGVYSRVGTLRSFIRQHSGV